MSPSRLLSLTGWVITASLFLAWYLLLAPQQVGGPASYVRVEGVSMEPTYKTGDLLVTSNLKANAVGEVAFFFLEDGTPIVHRLVGGNQEVGWESQGDNVDFVDPWVIPDAAVQGIVIFVIPGGADVLAFGTKYPLQVGAIFGALAALSYLPTRRKRLAPELKSALESAVREPRRDGRSATDYSVLFASSIATLTSLVVVVSLYSSKSGFDSAGWASVGGLVLSGVFTLFIVYRLYDGKFAREPASSLYALSGRLYRVKDFPSLRSAPKLIRSAVALRNVAEKYRLPVLHRIDPVNGEHSFLLILVDGSSIYWKPARHKASRSAELIG